MECEAAVVEKTEWQDAAQPNPVERPNTREGLDGQNGEQSSSELEESGGHLGRNFAEDIFCKGRGREMG